jgi:UDP-N-acetylglucosamine--N-acetylmuramyl-(pentapeptide) pyrophosphoryl-undecaprenol N-acetylglucosamine transferase
MNVVIAGGGTGGHLFPAIAVARQLTRSLSGVRCTFVGTARGIEAKIIPREGYDIRFIRSKGLVGQSFYKTVQSLLKIPLSIKDSHRALKEINPDLVFGVGGYSSGPVLLCAKLMGIPTIIHEQNTIPGFANKWLGKFVDAVAVTYQESIKCFPSEKVSLTGNPVREEILSGNRDRGYRTFALDRNLFTIFVFGGSRGAHSINEALNEALVYLEPFKGSIQFLHQTGERDYEEMKEIYHSRGFRGTVIPFAYDMADAYAVSDLVIVRAGATTLAEIAACGRAAILVPYPYAAANHQEINARKLWDIGAAQLILDRDLNGKSLADMIKFLFEDPDVIGDMERTVKSLSSLDAARKIMDLMMGLLKKKGTQHLPAGQAGTNHSEQLRHP